MTRPLILVVDHEPAVRTTIGRLLERAGYRARTAATGDEALALVRREHFDAVVCDVYLTGLSGARLCEEIWLAAPELAGRLIVASGDLTSDDMDALVSRTGLPSVRKPFTATDLLRAVGAICAVPSPAASSPRRAVR